MSIGIGSSVMNGASMLTAWKSTTGSYTIASSSCTGHTTPNPNPSQPTFTLLATPATLTPLRGALLSVTFSVPLASLPAFSKTGPTAMIYGFANAPPRNPDSPMSSFEIHDSYGAFSLDISKAGSSTGSTTASSAENYKKLHAIFMVEYHRLSLLSFHPL